MGTEERPVERTIEMTTQMPNDAREPKPGDNGQVGQAAADRHDESDTVSYAADVEATKQQVLEKLAGEPPPTITVKIGETVTQYRNRAENGLYYVEIFDEIGNDVEATLDRPEGEWHELLTGNREPTFASPGWYFRTYMDDVADDIDEILWSWVHDMMGKHRAALEDDDDIYGDVVELVTDLADEYCSSVDEEQK